MSHNATRAGLSKVPEITLWFWVIKICATTVGETAADYVNITLGFGLHTTTIVTVLLTVIALAAQFAIRRYVPVVYWLVVLLISVTGTLVTDTLTDTFGVPLVISTTVFALALIATFAGWYAVEGTLSIHSVRTARRETFYWLAILVTFALGTASGDLIAERLALGYGPSLAVFAAIIGVVTLAYYRLHLNAVLAFWIAYILTRPLGASLGDLLTQPTDAGGLAIGTTVTNIAFAIVIVGAVGYLSWSKRDQPTSPSPTMTADPVRQ